MGDERFAYDAYRRLINMYGDVVMGVEHEHFEAAFAKIKAKYKRTARHRCARGGSQGALRGLQGGLQEARQEPFPQDPMEQLELAIEAVFKSWNAPRAISYRRINEITGLNGTGVNVQTMVFGNMGDDSRHGRRVHPQPLHRREQVLRRVPDQRPGRGRRRRHPHAAAVDEMPKWDVRRTSSSRHQDKLEKHYKDMQDIEFTIEQGKLYMLQTRTGKRTGAAAVKIAVDMVKEADHEGRGAAAHPARRPDPAPAAQLRPQAKKSQGVLTQGSARLAGRRGGSSWPSPRKKPSNGRARARR
jgi:pyruvate,orthophosphate dikinase